MKLLFNDLSIHGQFHDLESFRAAVERIMLIRNGAQKFKVKLQCCRTVVNAQVTADFYMQQAVNRALVTLDKRRAFLQWLTRGPFWDDNREHRGDHWLECDREIVTDHAVGEAAYCLFHNIPCSIVSMEPSQWVNSPVQVDWVEDNAARRQISVYNYLNSDEVKDALRNNLAQSLDSWENLESAVKTVCSNLTFSTDSFEPLRGIPFNQNAAEQLLQRLNTLHNLKGCFNEAGKLTENGRRIYDSHFKGGNAWFSDSSDTEKGKFKKDLTFPHPEINGETLFCTWHGKVRHLQLRFHFSWPVQAGEPLYVVHVGQKITRR